MRVKSIILCCAIAVMTHAAQAFDPPTPEELTAAEDSFLLRPGAVVGKRRQVIYLMEPDGLTAREIASGELLWRTRAAAQPLGFYGETLMALAEGDDPNTLEILFLNAGDGSAEARVPAVLPEGVRASIDDGPAERFTAAASVTGGEVLLFWTFASRPLRGAPAVSGEAGGEQRLAGVMRLDPARSIAIPLEGELPAAPEFIPDLQPGERLSGLSGRQFRSADDRHVLASRRIADNRVWNRYEWSIAERRNGGIVGVIAHSSSYDPFFVAGSLLAHVSQPYMRSTAEGTVEARELSLNVFDMETSRAVWSAILRDTVFRGSMPP